MGEWMNELFSHSSLPFVRSLACLLYVAIHKESVGNMKKSSNEDIEDCSSYVDTMKAKVLQKEKFLSLAHWISRSVEKFLRLGEIYSVKERNKHKSFKHLSWTSNLFQLTITLRSRSLWRRQCSIIFGVNIGVVVVNFLMGRLEWVDESSKRSLNRMALLADKAALRCIIDENSRIQNIDKLKI